MKTSKYKNVMKKYQKLAFQFFGEYYNARDNTVYSGPVVSLVNGPEKKGLEPAKAGATLSLKKGRCQQETWRDERSDSGQRCLICYAGVDYSTTPIGSSKSSIDDQSFSTFLQIIRPWSHPNGINFGEDSQPIVISELKGSIFLCKYCCAATLQLISTFHSIRKLERKLLEMKFKILNAVKLSETFSKKSRRNKTGVDRNEGLSSLSSYPSNCGGVDKLRNFIIGNRFGLEISHSQEPKKSTSPKAIERYAELPKLEKLDMQIENNIMDQDQIEECENVLGLNLSDDFNDSNPCQEHEMKCIPELPDMDAENQLSTNFPKTENMPDDDAQKSAKFLNNEIQKKFPSKRRKTLKKPSKHKEPGTSRSSMYFRKYQLIYPGKTQREILKIRKELKRLQKEKQIATKRACKTSRFSITSLKPSTGEAQGNTLSQENFSNNGNAPCVFKNIEIKTTKDGRFFCGLCSEKDHKPVKSIQSIIVHINRKHHPDEPNRYECTECGKKFYYQCAYRKHVQDKHVRQRYQCHLCGDTFAHDSARFFHIRIVHQGIKPHTCEYCGKSFGVKKDLTIHVRRHTGEKPFVCHVCAASFIGKQIMKEHIRKHHPEQAEEATHSSAGQKDDVTDRILKTPEFPAKTY